MILNHYNKIVVPTPTTINKKINYYIYKTIILLQIKPKITIV